MNRWLEKPVTDCPCGRTHESPVARVEIAGGALDALPRIVRSEAPGEGALVVLADPDTWDAAGSRAAALLRAEGADVAELLCARAPHADDVTLATLEARLPSGVRGIVAVGAGTINDLGKALAEKTHAPLVTAGTAASMNGYASSIVALTERGLKKTLPARPARALVLDLDVISAAPRRLNSAGFGDLMSKPVSSADWLLSREFFGTPICPTALSMADEAVLRARTLAAGVGRAEPEALAALTEALVLSGLSMSYAGASSPASGGEHLISHYLDISEKGWGRTPRLHGEQVSVGTLVSLRLYTALSAGGPASARGPLPPEEDDDTLRALHAHLEGAALEELLAEARAKRELVPSRESRRALLATRWREIWQALDTQLAGSKGLAEDLELAGAPTRPIEIDLDASRLRDTVLRARHMRRRYTVLDLAADLGALEDLAAGEESAR
jgi:glycerol-1-phosphate dehydrogenase [NAD(P)+]